MRRRLCCAPYLAILLQQLRIQPAPRAVTVLLSVHGRQYRGNKVVSTVAIRPSVPRQQGSQYRDNTAVSAAERRPLVTWQHGRQYRGNTAVSNVPSVRQCCQVVSNASTAETWPSVPRQNDRLYRGNTTVSTVATRTLVPWQQAVSTVTTHIIATR